MSLSSGIGETCHTRILAQASCVDSVPLSSLISMEPRYCNEIEGEKTLLLMCLINEAESCRKENGADVH